MSFGAADLGASVGQQEAEVGRFDPTQSEQLFDDCPGASRGIPTEIHLFPPLHERDR